MTSYDSRMRRAIMRWRLTIFWVRWSAKRVWSLFEVFVNDILAELQVLRKCAKVPYERCLEAVDMLTRLWNAAVEMRPGTRSEWKEMVSEIEPLHQWVVRDKLLVPFAMV